MLITGQYPAGFLMLVHLLEIDSPQVEAAVTKKLKSPTTLHLHHWQVSHPRQASSDERRVHELNINTREPPHRDLHVDPHVDLYVDPHVDQYLRYTSLRLNTVKINGLDTY